MNNKPIQGIPNHGIEPTRVDPQGKAAPSKVEDPGFRRVLERLEELAKSQPAGDELKDADNFLDAMRQADQDFMQVMDLRRQIEQAYRNKQS